MWNLRNIFTKLLLAKQHGDKDIHESKGKYNRNEEEVLNSKVEDIKYENSIDGKYNKDPESIELNYTIDIKKKIHSRYLLVEDKLSVLYQEVNNKVESDISEELSDKSFERAFCHIDKFLEEIYTSSVSIFIGSLNFVIKDNSFFKTNLCPLEEILNRYKSDNDNCKHVDSTKYEEFVKKIESIDANRLMIDGKDVKSFYQDAVFDKYFTWYYNTSIELRKKVEKESLLYIESIESPKVGIKLQNSDYTANDTSLRGDPLDEISENLTIVQEKVGDILSKDHVGKNEYESIIKLLSEGSDFIYSACIGTFVQSFIASSENGAISTEQYKNIEWIIVKWKKYVVDEFEHVTLDQYKDFIANLKTIDRCDFEFADKNIFEFYESEIYGQFFKDIHDAYTELETTVNDHFQSNYVVSHSENASTEYVYILSNESMPDIVKVGKTNDIKRRLKELQSTGVPTPFKIEKLWRCKTSLNYEKYLHDKLNNYRISNSREFFHSKILDELDEEPDSLEIDWIEIEKNRLVEKYLEGYPLYCIKYSDKSFDCLGDYNIQFFKNHITKKVRHLASQCDQIRDRINTNPSSKNNLALEEKIKHLYSIGEMYMNTYKEDTLKQMAKEKYGSNTWF
ncbi:GIY-YIG nuclease family protein [Desulfopila sp. IMCC35008]|uniref:GIY-YIG nuclease family protein n=1 Tax=Desulfopila sp. IMCC35008 TaxID=2653858 RepID=UPI0013D7B4A5|nr:GIY-YIG nuclease family protein [Desulfopila sp. IMCC35008]